MYSHPESGALLGKHLGKIVGSLGWVRQEVHPGLWLHTATGAILTVYVDDLMMAARLRDEAGLWGALEKVVEFGEQPTPIQKFLCRGPGRRQPVVHRVQRIEGRRQARRVREEDAA